MLPVAIVYAQTQVCQTRKSAKAQVSVCVRTQCTYSFADQNLHDDILDCVGLCATVLARSLRGCQSVVLVMYFVNPQTSRLPGAHTDSTRRFCLVGASHYVIPRFLWCRFSICLSVLYDECNTFCQNHAATCCPALQQHRM
jgi:hypothetical protein